MWPRETTTSRPHRWVGGRNRVPVVMTAQLRCSGPGGVRGAVTLDRPVLGKYPWGLGVESLVAHHAADPAAGVGVAGRVSTVTPCLSVNQTVPRAWRSYAEARP